MQKNLQSEIEYGEKYILSGYGFGDQGPHLVLDTLKGNGIERIQFYIAGKIFTLMRFKSRYCTGRYDLETFDAFPCPKMTKLTKSDNQCFSCFKESGFNPSFYNVDPSQLSVKQQCYNNHPHQVYLAYFGKGKIKVGISHQDRLITRWTEQGARAATVIKTCDDAYSARQEEFMISQRFSIPEVYQSATKRKLLAEPYDFSEAREVIENMRDRIDKETSIGVEISEVRDMSRIYLAGENIDINICDVTAQKPLFISGTGLGMVGDILIVTQKRLQYMASIKPFISHVVRFDKQLKEHCSSNQQMKLF